MRCRDLVIMLAVATGCGIVGLALGWTIPLLLTDDSTAGPLWGIFVTGPLAFVAGMTARAIWANRRFSRIKRGLCPKCAYPIGTSDVCTECGTAVTRKVDTSTRPSVQSINSTVACLAVTWVLLLASCAQSQRISQDDAIGRAKAAAAYRIADWSHFESRALAQADGSWLVTMTRVPAFPDGVVAVALGEDGAILSVR